MSVSWTVGEFLAERELAFHAKSAKKFYRELNVLLGGLPTYQHGNTGMPEGISEAESCFFRGQASADWGLHSSLYRLLEGRDAFKKGRGRGKVEGNETKIAEAEKRILSLARENGVGRGLSQLETLTVLQHHGVPTRLIDVSTDWKVALYFACETLDSVDGRLFIVATSVDRWLSNFPKPEHLEEDLVWWDQGALNDWRHSVWPILLPFSDVRMISQRGFFLVGGLASNYGSHNYNRSKNPGEPQSRLNNDDMRRVSSITVEFPKNRYEMSGEKHLEWFIKSRKSVKKVEKWKASALTIKIPAEFKSDIRNLLKRDGVYFDSIYPPVVEVRRLLRYAGVGE